MSKFAPGRTIRLRLPEGEVRAIVMRREGDTLVVDRLDTGERLHIAVQATAKKKVGPAS